MKDTLSRWNGLQSPGSQKYFSIEIYGFAPLSRPIDFHNTQSPFNNIHPFVFVVFVQWPPCLCPYHVNITRNIAKVDPHVLFSSIRDRILSEQRRWDPFGIRYLKYELVCIMNQTIFLANWVVHVIIHIHNNMTFDWHDSVEYSHIQSGCENIRWNIVSQTRHCCGIG